MYRFRKALGTQLAEVVDHRGKTITVPFSGKGDPPKPGTIVQLPENCCCQPISCPLVPSVGSKGMPFYPTPRRVATESGPNLGSPVFINTYPDNIIYKQLSGSIRDTEVIPKIIEEMGNPFIYTLVYILALDAVYIPRKNPDFNELNFFINYTTLLSKSTHVVIKDAREGTQRLHKLHPFDIERAEKWVTKFGSYAKTVGAPKFWPQIVSLTLDRVIIQLSETTLLLYNAYHSRVPPLAYDQINLDLVNNKIEFIRPVTPDVDVLSLVDASKALALTDSTLPQLDWRGCIGNGLNPDYGIDGLVPFLRGLYVGNIAQPERGGLTPTEAAEVLKSTSPPNHEKIYQVQ